MMQTTLGTTNLSVSRIAFGCMSLKGNEAENTRLLQQAVHAGINFFDTADLYDKGANEALLGKALKDVRKQVVIATKVGNQWRPDGSSWQWNPSGAYIMEAVEASLRRLRTDYIDLYQLHGGTLDDPFDETMAAFETLQQQGKIRRYGISSIRPNVISRWVQQGGLASVMLQYSLLDRRPEETVLPLLHQKGIGVLARGALAQGLLLGKSPQFYLEHSEKEVAQAAHALHGATAAGHSVTGTALNWVLQHPAVTSAVVGIRTGEQLQQALAALHQPPLPLQQYQELSETMPARKYTLHR